MGGPMSIRGDVGYQVAVRQERITAPKERYISELPPDRTSISTGPARTDRIGNLDVPTPTKEFLSGAGEAIASPFRGLYQLGKQEIYDPISRPFGTRQQFEPLPITPFGTQQTFLRRAKLYSEPDVKALAVAGGTTLAIIFAPATLPYISAASLGIGTYGITTGILSEDYRKVGGSAVTAAGGIPFLVGATKGVYIRAGAKYVSPEAVFAESVLSGKQTLPTTPSIRAAIKSFQQTKTPEGTIRVVTVGDAPIKGTVAGVGKKAGLGLEDPGIFVTPVGEASPYFLRVPGTVPTREYTLSPIKGLFDVPTVTEFQATGVLRLPRSVIEKPGFEAVGKYQAEVLAGTGKVQITKRSELGLGEVQRQTFKKPSGALAREAGTSELEAVIPITQQFKMVPKTFFGRIKGFEFYTKYKGTPVAIRRAELISSKALTRAGKVRTVSGAKVRAGAASVSEATSRVSVTPSLLLIPSQTVSRGGGSSGVSGASYPSTTTSSSVVGSVVGGSTSYAPSAPSRVVSLSRPSGASRAASTSRAVSRSYSQSISRGQSLVRSYTGGYSRPGTGRIPSTASSGVFGRVGAGASSGLRKMFTAEVRRRGEFKRIGVFKTIRGAVSRGRGRVETTAAATFRVRGPRGRVLKLGPPSSSFYAKTTGEIIEKPSRRIKSYGELVEITYKGQAAARKKRAKRRAKA